MDTSRLSRGVAWFHIGLGLGELALPALARRLLGVPRLGGLVQACAVGRIATGVGLLTASDRRPWLWARVVGDLVDLSFLGSALQGRAGGSRWRLASTVAVLGLTVVDLQAVVKSFAAPAPRALGAGAIADTLNSGPMESWRGSGLAEDVGTGTSTGGVEEDPAREEKMREAQRQLGLPDPEPTGRHV